MKFKSFSFKSNKYKNNYIQKLVFSDSTSSASKSVGQAPEVEVFITMVECIKKCGAINISSLK